MSCRVGYHYWAEGSGPWAVLVAKSQPVPSLFQTLHVKGSPYVILKVRLIFFSKTIVGSVQKNTSYDLSMGVYMNAARDMPITTTDVIMVPDIVYVTVKLNADSDNTNLIVQVLTKLLRETLLVICLQKE